MRPFTIDKIQAFLASLLSIDGTRQDKSCPKGFKPLTRGKAQKGLAFFATIHKLFSITDKRQGSKFGQHLRGPSWESKSVLFGRVTPSRQCLYDTPGGTIGLPATGFTSRLFMPRHLSLRVKLNAKGLVFSILPTHRSRSLAIRHHAITRFNSGAQVAGLNGLAFSQPSHLSSPLSGQRSGTQPSRARAVFLFALDTHVVEPGDLAFLPSRPSVLAPSIEFLDDPLTQLPRRLFPPPIGGFWIAPPSDGVIVGVSFGPRRETYFVTCLVARTGRQSTPHSTAT